MSSGTSPGGVSRPASSSSTRVAERAERRLASTQAAAPAPTMMMSKVEDIKTDGSMREAEDEHEGGVQLGHCFGIDNSNELANVKARQCQHLVGHDLRWDAQAVFGLWFDGRPYGQVLNQVRRYRTHQQGCRLIQFVGLHHSARAGKAKLAVNRNDQAAPFYFH